MPVLRARALGIQRTQGGEGEVMAENPSDLVGKEFIFEYGLDRIIPPSEKTGGVFATEQRAYRRERVVRCRDCASYRPGHGVNLKPRCEKSIGTFVPEPDGFCAWGSEGDEQ